MKRELIAAAAALGMAAPVMAATGNNYVDGYLLMSDIDLGPVDDDGIGGGLKGGFQVGDQVYLTGEFQTVEYDDFNADFDQIRLGAGFGPGMGSKGEGLYGRAEYVRFDLDNEDDDGIAGHVGYGLPLNQQFRLHGELGYVLLDDVDGPELLVGGTYQVAPNIGIFADYRMSFLEVDGSGGGDVDINDLRVGARFYF